MWDKYIGENKGDYNIDTNIHHSQDSVNDKSVQTSIMDENKSFKSQVRKLVAENGQLKLEVKQLRKTQMNSLKRRMIRLKNKLKSMNLEFSCKNQHKPFKKNFNCFANGRVTYSITKCTVQVMWHNFKKKIKKLNLCIFKKIQTVFDTDISQDKTTIHPIKFCGACRIKLERKNNG